MLFADIWNCCELYKDCSLFQHNVNKPASWKLISATENVVCYDTIILPNTPTSAPSAETIVISDDMHTHELDVYTG